MDSAQARAARGRISESARSRAVGAQYGISAKTVRDIWNRVTWAAATEPLWTDQVRPRPASPYRARPLLLRPPFDLSLPRSRKAAAVHVPLTIAPPRRRRCAPTSRPKRLPAGSTPRTPPRPAPTRRRRRRWTAPSRWRSSAAGRASPAGPAAHERAGPRAWSLRLHPMPQVFMPRDLRFSGERAVASTSDRDSPECGQYFCYQ
jgi:hypothetical protein